MRARWPHGAPCHDGASRLTFNEKGGRRKKAVKRNCDNDDRSAVVGVRIQRSRQPRCKEEACIGVAANGAVTEAQPSKEREVARSKKEPVIEEEATKVRAEFLERNYFPLLEDKEKLDQLFEELGISGRSHRKQCRLAVSGFRSAPADRAGIVYSEFGCVRRRNPVSAERFASHPGGMPPLSAARLSRLFPAMHVTSGAIMQAGQAPPR